MKRIIAMYEGICNGCNKPIHRGMDIYWSKRGGAFHADCWRILRYLESSRAEEIESIANDENGFDKLKPAIQGYETLEGEVIGGIRSPRDAEDMRGQTARYLESFPTHPGLLFLRAASEAYCSDLKLEVIVENLIAGVRFALSRYLIDKEVVYEFLSWLLIDIMENKREICSKVVENLVYGVEDSVLARHILNNRDFSQDMLYPAGIYLFNNLAKKAVEILKTH